MAQNEDNNGMMYLLAGFGLGAIVGAAAGLLFAPKAGEEVREELGTKAKELQGRTKEWIAEQKAKKASLASTDEVGA
ncbi:MAG: YtxH domain-containing protein [Armatimonadetes bacterium]|nr:YtxH domain-containing protein [Armatimonadota bacterium]